MSEDLRYPVGQFNPETEITPELRKTFIQTISTLPLKITEAVRGLDDKQLDTPYRDGGWTLRQVVHHLADSHLNSFCRFKLALTEENPTIRPYFEDRWAELADSTKMPVEHSLNILSGLHFRWAGLLLSMTDEEFNKKLLHPESGTWTLEGFLALYDWHSRHHTAHITELRKRMDW